MPLHYTVYQIKNKINNKIYIGCHQTTDLNDGYMGSGKVLKYAFDKYGEENFTKDILFIFETPQEMFAKEAELVTLEFCEREDTYNVKLGGSGGWDYINANGINKSPYPSSPEVIEQRRQTLLETRRKLRENAPEWWDGYKTRISTSLSNYYQQHDHHCKGKPKTPEQRAKMSASAKINNQGSGNPNYGKRWMHKDGVTESVPANDIEIRLADGWKFGRK